MSESPPLALFRPVTAKRRRHDGWTAARQELFIIYLEQLGLVSAAAKAVGMSAKSAYALYNRSEAEQSHDHPVPSFAQSWHRAIEMGEDNAYGLAIQRATEGEMRPVFYRGRQVGERRVYNTQLLISAVNRHARKRHDADYENVLTDFLEGKAL